MPAALTETSFRDKLSAVIACPLFGWFCAVAELLFAYSVTSPTALQAKPLP
jgi:hypothetical protein